MEPAGHSTPGRKGPSWLAWALLVLFAWLFLEAAGQSARTGALGRMLPTEAAGALGRTPLYRLVKSTGGSWSLLPRPHPGGPE